jgi:hypothetical protein
LRMKLSREQFLLLLFLVTAAAAIAGDLGL